MLRGATGTVLAALAATALIALTGCAGDPTATPTDPPRIGTPTATPTLATATPTPRPTSTATPVPTPTLTAMAQPKKPYPSPAPLPLGKNPSELDSMKYAMEKVVWASLGTADPKTSAFCTTLSKMLVRATHPVHFTCTIKAGGVGTEFKVVATKKTDEIDYAFTTTKLPVTMRKVDYEAARQVFDPAKINCDVAKTKLVPVGDPDQITCWVTHPGNTRTRYFGELDRYGVLTFRTQNQLRKLASPSATPTTKPPGKTGGAAAK